MVRAGKEWSWRGCWWAVAGGWLPSSLGSLAPWAPWLLGSLAPWPLVEVGAEVLSVLDVGRAARPVPIPPRQAFTARVATGRSQPIVLSFSQPYETTTIVESKNAAVEEAGTDVRVVMHSHLGMASRSLGNATTRMSGVLPLGEECAVARWRCCRSYPWASTSRWGNANSGNYQEKMMAYQVFPIVLLPLSSARRRY